MNSKKEEQLIGKFKRTTKFYKILCMVLLLSLMASFFVLGNHHRFTNFRSQYPLIDPMRSFIAQEDFVVNIQPLRESLNDLIAKNSNLEISLYLEVLNTGANISINPQLPVFPASLAKLPLGMSVVKKVEMGKWNWDNELVLLEIDVDENSGALYQRPIGTKFTVEELVKELLVNSDNTAYKILVRNMDQSELFSVVQEIGLEELFIKDGRVSAKEYSRMFRALYTSSFLKRENSMKILRWLTETPFDDYLASGIPAETKFAHKIGENEKLGVYSDVGIVYVKNRPFLLAMMIHTEDINKGREKAISLMNLVAKQSYEYIQAQ